MLVPSLSDLLSNEVDDNIYSSLEFLPPRTEKGEEKLWNEHLPHFMKTNPLFVDITWGAGGRTSDKTMRLSKQIQEKYGIPVNMHITCTNMPTGLLKETLNFCYENGIRNILALRGDPPEGEEWKPNEEGFTCALDLVKFIRNTYGDYFCITVAGYPEGHPSRIHGEDGKITDEEMEKELNYLKAKVDAGANVIITQLFYDAEIFIVFVKKCRNYGITVPILPGILPISSYRSLTRMINLCKTYVPPSVLEQVVKLSEDDEALRTYGVSQAEEMVHAIQAADIGIKHFHFYVVNAPDVTKRILDALNFTP
ncbi:methylenetetrahydrofolate reductase (NADPH) [Trypanosoma theileri]|uniref:Methylenetetrahydrofolate reductase (NADPH) n=1 Tax=Trypanosoma theileri TaxID=67003 RepID=A0A1X0NM13_9TRYP|nr:methylenetetrahydrofolate reductase (NADPH) [Trypanosoma theileri]ORC85568.1 methylenetetrahydrofolate reductase (NADPH) [Trypanosoma theileri]